MEISRLDSATEQADLDSHLLGPLVRGTARVPGQEAEVHVIRDACVDTDRRRLERVLGNLLLNSHRHGCPPVTLTVDGPVITVRDHGAGYPAYLLDQGPQRFRTEPTAGHQGHGLGLTIATARPARSARDWSSPTPPTAVRSAPSRSPPVRTPNPIPDPTPNLPPGTSSSVRMGLFVGCGRDEAGRCGSAGPGVRTVQAPWTAWGRVALRSPRRIRPGR